LTFPTSLRARGHLRRLPSGARLQPQRTGHPGLRKTRSAVRLRLVGAGTANGCSKFRNFRFVLPPCGDAAGILRKARETEHTVRGLHVP
jgi:hypothetical protein